MKRGYIMKTVSELVSERECNQYVFVASFKWDKWTHLLFKLVKWVKTITLIFLACRKLFLKEFVVFFIVSLRFTLAYIKLLLWVRLCCKNVPCSRFEYWHDLKFTVNLWYLRKLFSNYVTFLSDTSSSVKQVFHPSVQ